MKLGDEEKQMLAGKYGRLVQNAMKFLVHLGEIYKAKRMIEIKYAFIYTAMHVWRREGAELSDLLNEDILREAIDKGVKVKLPTLFHEFRIDLDNWERLEIPKTEVENYKKDVELAKELGMIHVPTCAPYLVTDMYCHPYRTSIVSVESSAIAFFNSVLGARTNRDGISAFFAALTGKYPEYGYHIERNRAGDHLIEVKAGLKSHIDYGLLGFYVGEAVGSGVPVFEGIHTPKIRDLMALSSALSTGGAISMFHVVGVTPEAPTVETALGHTKPRAQITVTSRELQDVYKNFAGAPGVKVDFVVLGCPFYSIYEIKALADILAGARINNNVRLWILTDPLTKGLAESMGYARTIYRAGGEIISGTCPVVCPGKPGAGYCSEHPEYSIGNMASDSIKQAYYAEPLLNAHKVLLGDTKRCIKAAISGNWR